jgi:hypothetical protein
VNGYNTAILETNEYIAIPDNLGIFDTLLQRSDVGAVNNQ